MRCLLSFCLFLVALPLHGQPERRIAGLDFPPSLFLGGGTNTDCHPQATGTLKAILLFARFPDAQEGGHHEDAASKVRIDVGKKTAAGFQLTVFR